MLNDKRNKNKEAPDRVTKQLILTRLLGVRLKTRRYAKAQAIRVGTEP